MAALQTKTLTSNKVLGYQLQLILTEESTSVTSNLSSVSYKLVLTSGAYDFALYRTGWSIKLAGKVVSSCDRADAKQISLGTYSSVTIASGTANIAHEDDGSLNMTAEASIDMVKSSYTPGTMSLSGSMALTDIPRVSSVSAAAGTIGSALTIKISRQSSSFTHTLKYAFGNKTGTIKTKTTSTSVSWTPPMSLCSELPSSTSGTCTITCETYSDSTLIGTDTCTMKLTVPSSAKLTLSSGWVKVSPYNTGTAAAGISDYVQGFSKAQVTFDQDKISTADSYGAGIASYRVVYGDKDLTSPYRTGTLYSAGTFSVTCYVTDTRGRTQWTTLKFEVQPYANPTLSEISLFRCESDGTANDEGTFYFAKAVVGYSDLNGANSVTLQVRHKIGGEFGAYTTLENGVGKVLGNGAIAITSTYLIEIYAVDTLGKQAVYTGYVLSSDVFFHGLRGGKGAAFGKYAEIEDLLDIAWNAQIRKNLTVDGDIIIDGQSLKTLLGI